MNRALVEMFSDERTVEKIRKRLPYLFQIAEMESSRAGKVGMQVGSLRESIIVALLIHKFGRNNVETEIPIIEPEVDVRLFGQPISVKTITSKYLSGVKFSWTVDALRAAAFVERYQPKCDILFAQIIWNNIGGFYYIPVKVQKNVLERMRRNAYFKLPKPGTNPRGVEITKEAFSELIKDKDVKSIEVLWQRSEIDYNPFKRWVDYWQE